MDFFVLSIFLFVHFGLFGMAVRTDSQSQWIQCPARYSHCIMLWHSLTLWTWWCRCACFATLSVNGIDPFCVCVFFRGCDYDAMLRVLFFCVHLFNTILEIFRIHILLVLCGQLTGVVLSTRLYSHNIRASLLSPFLGENRTPLSTLTPSFDYVFDWRCKCLATLCLIER